MAILAALLAFGSRFVGKILTTALGWASTMLFGRVPASRQYLLLGITFGSVIWVVLLVGVLLPDVGTFLLVFVPKQDLIPESTVRLIMLIGALVAPAVIGGITLMLTGPGKRTPHDVLAAVARGYPLTALLAVLLVFLAALAIARKAVSLARGWTDAHVPLVVLPGRYDDVAADLDAAVTAAGLDVEPRLAPAYLAMPARWLAAVAGTSAASLVPERMIRLQGRDLDILIYSMDLLVSGKPKAVARARGAMASRLTTSAAHLTVSAEAQAIEDRLAALARPAGRGADAAPPPFDDTTVAAFEAIDAELANLQIPYDEWEVLYRQRLQVERDLRAGAMAAQAVVGAATPGAPRSGVVGLLEEVGRIVRNTAEAAVEVASDERTGQAFDRLA
ncbi:MAG TPA: hypothetical protein VGQ89_04070 [Candidatus Limnocylindrales bacterium]|nr:hypothetical protein [Candidatus Limnocylindrales bacterium]